MLTVVRNSTYTQACYNFTSPLFSSRLKTPNMSERVEGSAKESRQFEVLFCLICYCEVRRTLNIHEDIRSNAFLAHISQKMRFSKPEGVR